MITTSAALNMWGYFSGLSSPSVIESFICYEQPTSAKLTICEPRFARAEGAWGDSNEGDQARRSLPSPMSLSENFTV